MYKIAILGDLHDWHTKRIQVCLSKQKCEVFVLNFKELSLCLFDNEITIRNNKKLLNIDGVWVRFIENGSLEEVTSKLTILHLLEESGVYVHNSPSIIEKTVDKVRATGILEINKILSPKTFISFKKNKEIQIPNFKNYLLKPIFGSQGKNIKLVKNSDELENYDHDVMYLQEFLGDLNQNKFSDYRILVSNHKIVSAMERSSENYITNAYQGAECKKLKISHALKSLSEKISKVFKLGYAGIDIKKYKNSLYTLEINGIPSWKNMQNIEKNNITKILVDDFLEKVVIMKNEFRT